MRAVLVAALGLSLWASAALADGGLVLAPTRLVFGPAQTSAEVVLTNTSKRPMRYGVSLVDQVMTASASTVVAPEGFAYSAKDMLRYMPKVVQLAPGARQVIRVLAERPDNLGEGDYHTHMLFSEIVMPVQPVSSTADEGFKMEIGMSYSMAIPVVVEKGKVTGTIAVESAARTADKVELALRREGNGEGYADVAVMDTAGEVVSAARKVRIYREIDGVMIDVPLKVSATTPLKVRLKQKGQPDVVADVR